MLYIQFSQIDGTNPILNLTVNETLLDAGTVAVDLCKSDIGSGVASVDIYELIGIIHDVGIRYAARYFILSDMQVTQECQWYNLFNLE